MVAYVVILREKPVHNQAEMEEYARKAPRDIASFGMTVRAFYGTQTPLEGEPADGIVILEFPSVEDAKAWYYSDDYQAASSHRMKAADYRMMILEGV